MAKKRKPIDILSHDTYQLFIDKIIANNELSVFLLRENEEIKAIKGYQRLTQIKVSLLSKESKKIIDLDDFNQWCDRYISRDGWKKLTRRKTTFNHRKSEGITALSVKKEIQNRFGLWAKNHNLGTDTGLTVLLDLAEKYNDEVETIIENPQLD